MEFWLWMLGHAAAQQVWLLPVPDRLVEIQAGRFDRDNVDRLSYFWAWMETQS